MKLPKWFKTYLENLPNDLASELRCSLRDMAEGDADLYDEIESILSTENERRKGLGIA